MAMGAMSSTVMVVLSPGMHISTPSGSSMVPVTLVAGIRTGAGSW